MDRPASRPEPSAVFRQPLPDAASGHGLCGRAAGAPVLDRPAAAAGMVSHRRGACGRLQTPACVGSQRILCCWSCSRTGSRDSRIQPASSVGLTWPNAALNKTGQRRVKPRERTISIGPIEIGATANDDLDLVDRLEPVEVAPDVGVDLAGAGRLDVEDHAHAGIDRAVSIAPLVSSKTVLPASASRVMSGYTSGCNSGSPPVISTRSSPSSRPGPRRRRDRGPDPRRRHAACRSRRTAGCRPSAG